MVRIISPVRATAGHRAGVASILGQVVLLAGLAATAGLSPTGWLVGTACGLTTGIAFGRGLNRSGATAVGPANLVTLVRATLVGGVAALVTDAFVRTGHTALLVALSTVALVLDAVDGRVARRTGTVTPVGARFDMEVDAFLILVLSVLAARSVGAWVLLIGLARYAFVLAGWRWPWLRAAAPPRPWCKVVAALQGIVLTVCVSGVMPVRVDVALAVTALALLAESFGRETSWLCKNRATTARPAQVTPPVARTTLTVAAAAVVWFALVAPTRLSDFTLGGFLRLPVEGLVVVVVCIYLPVRAARIVAFGAGLVLGVLTIVKILDVGFYDGLDRPFNPVSDWSYVGPAVGVLRDSIGSGRALVAEIGIVLVTTVIMLVMPLSMLRVTRAASHQKARSTRAILALGGVWIVVAALGVQTSTGNPVASAGAAGLAYDQVHEVRSALADQKKFAASISAPDAYAITPSNSLLTGLRGKDVIFAFVESYGQVAVQDSTFSAPVDAVLDAGTRQLDTAGYASRSAFLTSPTFGGISWLAHSTLQTGLWIDNQQRYDQVVRSSRFTLSDAFKRAGWRTVGDVPSNKDPWPEGTSFYHYDQLYDEHNVGYQGPKFSYASMPDQYTLSAFQSRELTPGHQPVMAEIDLVSSHTPWTPLPHMIGWDQVGNGSIYDPMPARGRTPADVWRSAAQVQSLYGQSVQYSLTSLISFVQHVDDPNLVLVMLGDHQPATIVSGTDATHEVPITIVAHDPQVLNSISSWGWQDGLLPSPQAPVWPMDAFRDRFLTAFQSPSR